MEATSKLNYRPEIDGLRAIAVSLVIAFHAGFGCPGGYIGVDVFFVISGFLITSLILKDLENNCFSLTDFWERRARRILPVLAVVILSTLLAGCFLLLPGDLESLGRATASQAVFASNIYHWRTSGYFSATADEKPLLHTWSLAVEEQFYLIAPLLIWVMYRCRPVDRRRHLTISLIAGFIVSFSLSVIGVARYPSSTFYLLPTRAWELILGAVLANWRCRSALHGQPRFREVGATTGLVLIVYPSFFYTERTSFPGLAALVPCLGTALVIATNSSHAPLTLVGTLLACRPLRFIGRISYSLYLWHWPVLAFCRYFVIAPLCFPARCLAISFAIVLAIMSYRFVETPFRERRLGRSQHSMFCFGGAAIAASFCCGGICVLMQGFPQRIPSQMQRFAEASTDTGGFLNELNREDVRSKRFVVIGKQHSTTKPSVFVWGDSHAMAALPAFDALLKEREEFGQAATHSSTPPLLDWCFVDKYGLGANSREYNDLVFSYLEQNQITRVFLVAHWSAYRDQTGAYTKEFQSALISTVKRLADVGCCPTILLEVPVHSFDVPKALTRFTITPQDVVSQSARPGRTSEFDGLPPAAIDQILRMGGRILDPKPGFLSPTGDYYMTHCSEFAYYRDHDHLTSKGAHRTLLPLLIDSMALSTSDNKTRRVQQAGHTARE